MSANSSPPMPDFSKFNPDRMCFLVMPRPAADPSHVFGVVITAMEAQTAPPARSLLSQTNFPSSRAGMRDLVVLDNGCGFGIVVKCIFELYQNGGQEFNKIEKRKRGELKVVCADLQDNMVAGVRVRAKKEGWLGVQFQVVDSMTMCLPNDLFTHVFSNFLVQLLPDATAALKETFRVLQPGGYTGYTVWSAVGWLPMIQSVLPDFKLPFTDHALVTPAFNVLTMGKLGFRDVQVNEMSFSVSYESAKIFSDMLAFSMPHIFQGHFLDTFVRGLEAKHGVGKLEVRGWKALVVTAMKPTTST